MTAKPIVVVYIPTGLAIIGGREFGWNDCNEVSKSLETKMPDYYCIVLLNTEIENVEFKVFYEKDFTPIQYEELKKLITDSINKTSSDEVS